MDPWKVFGTRNRVLGRRPAPVRPKSGDPTAMSGRARAGKGPAGPRGSILGLARGRGATDELARRSGAATAADAAVPARLHLRRGKR
jgi:hypothetical protein